VVYDRQVTKTAEPTAASYGASALLNHLARLARTRSEAALDSHGLRPRHLVLLNLLRDHDGISQQGLAGALQIDKTNLVGLLNALESDGLVERRRSVKDRRRHIVEITPAGVRKLARAEKALGAVEDELLAALSQEEREALHQLLQRATSDHVLDCMSASQEWVADDATA
jgi:DNA-binding MarR family transcriptional regulator